MVLQNATYIKYKLAHDWWGNERIASLDGSAFKANWLDGPISRWSTSF
jgi:hypothetical protein